MSNKKCCKLLDALDVYADVLIDVLDEMKIDSRFYTQEELRFFAKVAFGKFDDIWKDYVLWVLYGDNKKEKTIALLRARRNKNFLLNL